MRVYLLPAEPTPVLHQRREEHVWWLQRFAQLHELAIGGGGADPADLYLSIEEHLAWEEAHLFPAIDGFLGDNRVTRELGYEHLGIRRLLPQLSCVLDGLSPASGWTVAGRKRAWEKFSLDMVHLLEHHLEHEELGVYPLYERLV